MVKTKIEKLDNGLLLILSQDTTKHTAFAELMTNFGGMKKDFIADGKEYHLIDGIAHLLEHTLIDNSKYGNVLQHFNEQYVTFNGITTKETTSFYIDTAKNFESALVKLINIVNVATFDEKSLETSKLPIYDEIRKNEDRRFYNYNRKYTESIFVNSDFRNNLGTLEEIKNVDYELVKKCHDIFYHPQNQILMISGNFDMDEIKELVIKTYEEINKEKHEFKFIDIDISDKLNKKEITIIDEKEDELVNVTFKLDISHLTGHEGLMAAYYISYFLRDNFDDSSSIYEDLISKRYTVFPIDYSISKIYNYLFIDIGCFTNEKEYFVNQVLERMKNKSQIEEEKFTLMKKREIVSQILKEESCNALMRSIVDNIRDHSYYDHDKLSDVESLSIEGYKEFIDKFDFSDYFIITQKKGE